ncbi:MAG TPA: HEAT repeat domain-containing protein, partial [Blastocatellia bacterium]|nr:HEAT repeat domain-containing protein [Blastocatellia bacterium]
MIKREVLALAVLLAICLSASATFRPGPQSSSAKTKTGRTQPKRDTPKKPEDNPQSGDNSVQPGPTVGSPSNAAQSDTGTEPQSESGRRAQQLMALVDSRDADRAPKIKRGLSDDDWYLRGEAALALSMLRDQTALKDAIPDLSRLIKDQSWFVRSAAVQALSGTGDPSAVQAVLALLDPSDPYACAQGAALMGKLGYAPAGGSLMKLLADENDPVRAASAEALGNLKDQRAVDPLISLLKDEMPSVRLAAAVALGSIG